MGDKTRGTQGRMPVSGLIKIGKGKRRRTSRNWAAAFVAASVAVAWTVGGLVMPSMAAEPAAVRSVHPDVTVSGGSTADVSSQATDAHLYLAAMEVNLFTTTDFEEAKRHYGETQKVGDFTAQYLPRSCFVRDDNVFDETLENYFRQNPSDRNWRGKRYGAWALYPHSNASFSMDRSAGVSADRSADVPEADGESDSDTMSVDLAELETEALSDIDPVSEVGAPVEAPVKSTPTAETPDMEQLAPKAPPAPKAPQVEQGETQAKNVPDNGSGTSANSGNASELSPSKAEKTPTKTEKTPTTEVKEPEAGKPSVSESKESPKAEKPTAEPKETKSSDSRTKVNRPTATPSKSPEGSDPAKATPSKSPEGADRSAGGTAVQEKPAPQDRSVFVKFLPQVKFDVKYDPKVDKETAMAKLEKDLDAAWDKLMEQLNKFANDNNLSARLKNKLEQKYKAKFDELRQKTRKFLESKYATDSGSGNWRQCDQNGPIVPNGTLVLINESKYDSSHTNVWYIGQKTDDYTILRLHQYASSSGVGIKADGSASFCVEPHKVLAPGKHQVFTEPSAIEWAQKNPEKADKIKALVWHYKQHGSAADYGRYQNAIWATVLGLPEESIGLWKRGNRGWEVRPGAAGGLLSQAMNEYQNRPAIISALEAMHLDQLSVEDLPDGQKRIYIQLKDYDTNPAVRRAIGNQIYLRVRGATSMDGNTPNRIDLVTAETGLYLNVKNPNGFRVEFAGSIERAEDAYFLNSANTQAQVAILSKKITVSGPLNISWGVKPHTGKPQIGTTVLVNGTETNPGGSETVDLSTYQGDFIELSDDVEYSDVHLNVTKNIPFIVAKIKRVRDGVTTDITKDLSQRPLLHELETIPDGLLHSVFSVKIPVSEMRQGDKYYFEEYIVSPDPKYEKNEKIDTVTYGWLPIIAKHVGENPDQTVDIRRSNAKLRLAKRSYNPDHANVQGQVRFDVMCSKDNRVTTKQTVYTSAIHGDVSKEIDVLPGSTCTVTETYSARNLKFTSNQGVTFYVKAKRQAEEQLNTPATVNVGGDGHSLTAYTTFEVPQDATDIYVEVNNTYNPDYSAQFILEKQLNVEGNSHFDGVYRFSVNCDGYQEDALNLNKANNYRFVLTQLKGKALKANTRCTVKEIKWDNPESHDWNSVDYQVNGANGIQNSEDNSVTFTLPPASESTVTVTATNNYNRKKGSLKVTKFVSTNAKNNPWKNQAFNFEADCFTPPVGNASLAAQTSYERWALGRIVGENNAQWIKEKSVLPNNYLLLADKSLPVGTMCLVWENEVAGDVKPVLTWKGAGNDVVYVDGAGKRHDKARRVFITADDGDTPGVQLFAANSFQVPYGTFKISKKVTGDAAKDAKVLNTEFTFKVKCDDVNEQTIKVKPNQTKELPKNLMKAGSSCRIHEETPRIDGITSRLISWEGNNNGEEANGDLNVTVPAAGSPELTIWATNEVKQDTAKFKIRKLVTPSGTEFNGNFRFTYSCVSGNTTYTQKNPFGTQAAKDFIEVASGQDSAEITVPANSKCHVSEDKTLPTVKSNEAKNPLKYSTLVFNPVGEGQRSGEFSPAKDQTITISATNTYTEKMTGFQFEKSVSGNNANNHTGQSYTFEYSCKAPNGKLYEGTKALPSGASHKVENLPVGTKCALWEHAVTPKANEVHKVKWIKDGQPTTTEMVRDFRESSKSHANGVNFTVDKEGTAVVLRGENSFDIPETSLTINKQVAKGEQAVVAADKEYRVNVSCVYSTDNTKHTIAADQVLTESKSVTFKHDISRVKIPVGSICTVEEVTASAEVIGHNWTVQLQDGNQVISTTNKAENIQVPVGGKTVTVKNIYNRKTGGFKLTKALAGEGLEESAAIAANKGKFEFEYNCVLDGQSVKTGKIAVTPPNVAEVTGIPAGAVCTLNETAPIPPTGFAAPHVSWQVNGTDSGAIVPIVEKTKDNAYPTVTATNTYTPYQVKFNLRKVRNADDGTHPDGDYRFNINCGDGKNVDVSLNASNNYSWTSANEALLKGLSAKTCTIKETALPALPDHIHKNVQYTVSSNVSSNVNHADKSVSFTFPQNGDVTVDVTATNNYIRQQGSIKIMKRVEHPNADTNPWADKTYSFEADCSNPVMTWNDHDSLRLSAGKEGTFQKGRWVGSVCHVWENTTSTTDVTNQLTWEGDGETVASYTDKSGVTHQNVRKVVIKADKDGVPAVQLTAKNTLTVQYGTFELSKKLSGNAIENEIVKNTDFTFKVKCADLPDQTLTLKPGETKAVPSTKMKVGSTCTVHEVPATIPGVTTELNGWEGSGFSPAENNGITVTIPQMREGTPNPVFTANNQVDYDQGKFKIKKSVIPAEATFNANFKFSYTCEAPAGKTISPTTALSGNVEVPARSESAEIIVPAGSTCQITELNPETDPQVSVADNQNPLKYQGTAINGTLGKVSQKIIVGKDSLVEFEATNTYVEQTTGFQISKTVSGNNKAKHTNDKFTFHWSCKARNGKLVSSSQEIAAGHSHTVKELPVGTECVVWEDAFSKLSTEKAPTTTWTVANQPQKTSKIADFQGKERTNAVKFTIKNNDSVSVTADNSFDIPDSSLTIEKLVDKDKLSVIPDGKVFKVKIDCVYPTDGQKHVLAEALELKAGKSHTFKTDTADVAIPEGATCTVTEDATSADVPGHDWSVKLKDGSNQLSITPEATVTTSAKGKTVTIVNKYQRKVGGFTLEKEVAGKGLDFETAAKANNGKFDFTYDCQHDGKALKNGKGTLSITSAERVAKMENLPEGTICTLSETTPQAPLGYSPAKLSWTVDGAAPADAASAKATVTIGKNKIAKFVATNTYEPYEVKFKLEKKVTSDGQDTLGGDHGFRVICGDVSQDVSLNASNNYTWDSSQLNGAKILSGQKCTIVETNPAIFANYSHKSVQYTVNGVAKGQNEPEKGVSFTLPKTGNASVTVIATNHYVHKLGSLKLQKTVSVADNASNPWQDKSYNFTVDCYQPADGNALGEKIADKSKTVTLKAGAEAKTVVEKAKVGTVCLLKENVENTQAVTNQLAWEGAGNTVTQEGIGEVRRVVITEDAADVPVSLVKAVNKLEIHYGTFSLSKKLTGDAAEDEKVKDTAFNFQVDCDDVPTQSIAVKPGQTVDYTAATGQKVKVGSTCRVHEVPVAISGVASELTGWEGATPKADKSIDFEIPAAGTPTVTFTAVNNVSYDKASFQIKKVADPVNTKFSAEFKFTYSCSATMPNGKTAIFTQKTPFNGQAPADYVLVAAGGNSAEISVPAGATCQVTEVNPQAEPTVKTLTGQNEVKYDSTQFNPGGKGATSDKFVAAKGTVVEVTATNIYVEKKTGFKFSKTVSGNNKSNHKNETYNFGWTCKAPNGTITDGNKTLTAGAPAVEVAGLPVKTECILWEDSSKTANGKALTDEKISTNWTIGDQKAVAGSKLADHKNASHDNAVGFTVETENKTVVIGVDNVFDIPGTALKVSKKVVKGENAEVPADKKYLVNITCEYPTDGTNHTIKQGLELTDGHSETFKTDKDGTPIPVGAKCTVTEDETSAVVTGHSWKVEVKDPNKLATTGVTSDEAKNTVEVVNTYERKTGSFKLSKAVVGVDFAEAAKANDGRFTFTYDCKIGTKNVKHGDLNLDSAKDEVTVKDIPQGAVCTITETTTKPTVGYAGPVATWTVDGTETGTGVVNITEDREATVKATNTYKPYQVSFNLRKIATANQGKVEGGSYTFRVTCGGKSQDVTLDASNSYAWDSSQFKAAKVLSGQSCTVAETKPHVFKTHSLQSTSYQVNGIKATTDTNAKSVSFTLPETGDVKVDITATNTYRHKVGSLEIEKTARVTNADKNPWDNRTYKFGADCYDPDENGNQGKKTLWAPTDVKAGKTASITKNRLVGSVCYVWEREGDTDGVSNTLEWDGSGETVSYTDVRGITHDKARKVVITETKEGASLKVKATNNLKVNYGTFKLHKVLTGDAEKDSTVKDTKFTFKVKCEGLKDQVITLKGGDTVTLPENKMMVGTKCVVHEEKAQIPGVTTKLTGWNKGATTTADGGIEVIIPKAEVKDLTFTATNEVTFDKAQFKIRKAISSPVDGLVFNGKFKFTYTCEAPNKKTYTQKVPFNGQTKVDFIEVDAGQDSAVITVPKGSRCSVTEVKPNQAPTVVANPNQNPVRYGDQNPTIFDPQGKGLTSGEFTPTTVGQEVKVITATNTYVEKMTGFQFTKQKVDGNNAGKRQGHLFNFGYSCSYNGKEVKDPAKPSTTASLAAGQTESVQKLPVGTRCVLWENPVQPRDNEVVTAKWSVDGKDRTAKTIDGHPNAVDFTVDTENKPVVISVVNTFDIPATTLKIHKVISKDNKAEVPSDKAFKVSVNCEYPTDNKTHEIAKNIAIKAEETKEFTKDSKNVAIPVGASCTITEDETTAKLGGHTWTLQMKDGETLVSDTNSGKVTVPAGGKTITMDNHYARDFGAFKITKDVVAGSYVTQPASYQFTYKCSDPKDTTKFVDGDMTVTAEGSAFSKEIPVGYTCEVKEAHPKVKGQDIKGVKWNYTLSDNKFTIEKPKVEKIESVMVSATNNFSDANGKFQVKKVIAKPEGADPAVPPANAVYNFEYQCTAPGAAVPTEWKKFSITGEGTWTSPEIPSGSECAIRELQPTGEFKGIDAEVTWAIEADLTSPAATAVAAPIMVEADKAFVFGREGESARKFTIGKNDTVRKLSATNKFSHADVELTLQKVAESTDNNGTTVYSKDRFVKWHNYYASFGNRGWGGFVTKKHVDMKVTCGDKVLGTYQVPINGEVVKIPEKVPYNTKCTVAELDTAFNDYNMLFYGRWRHSVEMSATYASGGEPIKKSYAFDAVKDDGENAAITFEAKDKTSVAVKMLNRWDCFASVESTLGSNYPNAPIVDGVRQIDLSKKNSTDRVTISDTVRFVNLPEGEGTSYTIVGRLFDASEAGKLTGADFNNPQKYLSWTSVTGQTWSKVHQYGITNGSATRHLTYDLPSSLLEAHPNGIAAAVAVYRSQGDSDCEDNCGGLIAIEASLPQSQRVKPVWSGELRTKVLNPDTKSNMLQVGKGAPETQTITDTVTYKNVAAGSYDLYGRIVALGSNGNLEFRVGEGTKTVSTTAAGSNALSTGEWSNDQIVVKKADLEAAVQQGANKFVTYEFLLPKGTATSGVTVEALKNAKTTVASHVDPTDVQQQLFTPTLKTTATVGSENGTKTVDASAKGTVEVFDKVEYRNLPGGKSYEVTGKLHVKNADGTDGGELEGVAPATGTIDLANKAKTESFNGTITLKFTVPAEKLQQKTVVAFEEVKDGHILVAAHADITDEAQTVYSPKIGTLAAANPGTTATADTPATVDMSQAKPLKGKDSSKKVELGGVEITDSVAYYSLEPGQSYVIYGELMKLDKGNPASVAAKANTGTFKVSGTSAVSGTKDIKFPALTVQSGDTYVVYEYLFKAGDFNADKPDTKKAIASHADSEDKGQTVTVPGVTTDATDGDGDKYVDPSQNFTIKDTVTATGLIPGKTYDVSGELMVDDGTPQGAATGIKQTGTITAKADGTGETVLEFTVTAKQAQDLGLVGKPIVVFEDLSLGGKKVAVHHDIKDEKQTVYNGGLKTKAVDAADENQAMVPGQKSAAIVDTVTFNGRFEKSHSYTLVGELHYVDGTVVPGTKTETKTVQSDQDGVIAAQEMTFTVPAESIKAGQNMVVFEKLFDAKKKDGTPVASHEDPNDPDQTITVQEVEITTTAYDGAAGDKSDPKDKNLDASKETVTIYDQVDYKGLNVGEEYTITGTLHYQADATLADGTQVKRGDEVPSQYVSVTPAKITANKASSDEAGAVKAIVKFEVQKAALATAPVVVFETLYQGTVEVATHKDIDDGSQVVYHPSLRTLATVNGAKVIQVKKDSKENLTVTDQITWANLAPGSYTLEGSLMEVKDGQLVSNTPVAKGEAQKVEVAGGETGAATNTGEAQMTFELPVDKVKSGSQFVVYQSLKDKSGQVVATHEDPKSGDQTVTVGSLDTTATDAADGNKHADNSAEVTINDKVDYSGLNLAATYPDGTLKAYLVKGELMDKATGKPVAGVAPVERVIGAAGSVYRVGGQDRPVEEVITSGTGSVVLSFQVPAKLTQGKVLVAFETVYEEGQEFLIHHDINDDAQTVYTPGVKTQARVDSERNLLLADKDSTIKDTVTLSGLKTGETYVLSGVLMDKATGQPILGKDMQAITAVSKPFKAESGSFVKTDAVSFTVPAGTVKAGTELVVFEKLWIASEVTVDTKTKTVTPKDTKTGKNQPAASHEDITDENQTVKSGASPSLKTVLSADGKREWLEGNADIPTVPHASDSLVDTVLYTGLTEGVSYRLDAELMEINPVTGEVSKTPVATGYTQFTAKTSDGTAQVTFNGIAGKLKAGYKYVAYEKMTRPGQPDKPVPPPHEDPKDPNQTVVVEHNPGITTTLTDAQAAKGTDGKVISLTQDAQLKDVVEVTQTGLIEGAKYYVFSKLVNQANPNQVVAAGVEEFTATGDKLKSVTVNFTVPKETLQELAGSNPSAEFKLVAYEYLALSDDTDIVNKEATSETEAVVFKTGKTWAATHADPNDAGQTVTVVKAPKIGTTLKYGESKTVWVADKVVLTDTVEYFNLQPNTKYTLSGKLMGGANAENLSDTGVEATTEFTTSAAANGAQTVSGTAVVKFTVPREVLEKNEKLVAYEYLTIDGNPVASHEDPKDENQTVTSKKPGVGTSATVDGLKAFDVTDGKKDTFTIKDTVRLYNVEEGKTYAIAGQLYEQSVAGVEGKALAKAAQTVKVTAAMAKGATAVEKAKYGDDVKVYETTMNLIVKRSELTKNQVVKDDIALVVYEQLWAPGTYEKASDGKVSPKGKSEPVAKHNDPQSSSQSITAEPQFGSLKLIKTVTGWEDAFAKVARTDAMYKFTVKCAQKGSEDEFTLKEGDEKTVEGIPLGDTCTISEDVQGAVNQAGLKDTVKFVEVNGVTVESQVNGEAVVKIGGTANGSDTVANVEVTAENAFSYDPVITTNTTSQFGKVLENGGVLTDTVTYKQMPAGNYVLHTYFVEMVKDESTGKTVAKKIDYVPSYITEQTVKAEATTPENGYNGTWTVSVDIPDTLHEVGKKVVVWQDVYVAPQATDMAKFKEGLNKLSAGETSKVAKLVVSHHETSEQQGDGYQWFRLSSNYGSFQVEKAVALGKDLTDRVKKQLPRTFKFEYEAKLPAGALLKPGTQPIGEFTLTVDPNNPALAKSPVFEGFPVGTEVTITETGVEGTMPTGVTMDTTWATADGKAATKAWSSAHKSDKVTVKIQPRGLLQVTAINHFENTYPELATLATTADGAKILKPSEATPVLDTVTYSGLVADREYWLLTQLVYTDDSTPVLGADGQPLVRWTKVSAGKDGQGTWVVDKENPLVVPETTDPQRDLVFFESLFEVPNTPGDDGTKPPDPTDPSNPPIAEHKDPKDPKQVVSSRPKLEMQTVATLGGDAKTIKAGEGGKISDSVTYNGLKAGGIYTLVGKLVKKTDGKTIAGPVTLAGLQADASGSGKWTMDIPLTAAQTKDLKQGDELVVFEKAYLGKVEDAASNPNLKPALAHEDLGDSGQTITVTETPEPPNPPNTPPNVPPGTGTPPGGGTPPPGGGTPPPGGNVPPPELTQPPVNPSTTTPPIPPVSPSTTTPPPIPPVLPATTIPPAQAKIPPTLARTGAQAAITGVLSLAMIVTGAAIGLLAARRKREAEK